MTGVQTIEVADDDDGVRLDRWFRRHFPALGHGRLQKLLRTGQVRVDGGRAKANARLAAGQSIRVPPMADDAPPPPKKQHGKSDPRDAEALTILHDDDHVLVIDKPPGLAVQGGTGTTRHLDAMLDHLRRGKKERPRLVHRLDRDTSGVLVLARTAKAAGRLAEAFKSRDAKKLYWAIVVGEPELDAGVIDLALSKRAGKGGERVAPGGGDAKRAETFYRVVDHAGKRAAWLALEPQTGRTHQVRVHCAAIGTPILGDGKYGGRDAFVDGVAAKKLHLHARALVLPHPAGGTLEVAAPLPPHMAETWRFLGFEPSHPDGGFAEACAVGGVCG